jgi:hypothetical protein
MCAVNGGLLSMGQRLGEPAQFDTMPRPSVAFKDVFVGAIAAAPHCLIVTTSGNELLQQNAGRSRFHKLRFAQQRHGGSRVIEPQAALVRTCATRAVVLSEDRGVYTWRLPAEAEDESQPDAANPSGQKPGAKSAGAGARTMAPVTAVNHLTVVDVDVSDDYIAVASGESDTAERFIAGGGRLIQACLAQLTAASTRMATFRRCRATRRPRKGAAPHAWRASRRWRECASPSSTSSPSSASLSHHRCPARPAKMAVFLASRTWRRPRCPSKSQSRCVRVWLALCSREGDRLHCLQSLVRTVALACSLGSVALLRWCAAFVALNPTVFLGTVLRHVSDADLRELDFELHRLTVLSHPRGVGRPWGWSSYAELFESAVAGEKVLRRDGRWELECSAQAAGGQTAPAPSILHASAPAVAQTFEALSLDDDDAFDYQAGEAPRTESPGEGVDGGAEFGSPSVGPLGRRASALDLEPLPEDADEAAVRARLRRVSKKLQQSLSLEGRAGVSAERSARAPAPPFR